MDIIKNNSGLIDRAQQALGSAAVHSIVVASKGCLFIVFGILLGMGNIWPAYQGTISSILLGLAVGIAFFSLAAKRKNLFQFTVVVFLLALYGSTSVFFNLPTTDGKGVSHLNNSGWWITYFKMLIASLLVGFFAVNEKERIKTLIAFCGTGVFIGVAFALYSIFYGNGVDYGNIWNCFTGRCMNSPGIMSLIIPLPVLLFARKITYKTQLLPVFLAYCVVSILAFGYASRSVFLILYLIVPVVALFITIFYFKNYKSIIYVLLTLAVFCVLGYTILEFSSREIDFNIFKDGRFIAYKYYFHNLLWDPFAYPRVPAAFEQNSSHHFHNFFADAHRLSGFWSFLSAVLLVGYIGIRVLQAAIKAPEGRMLLMVLIPVFLILNTSVVPEGEFQPILLILLLGGCAESILREKRMQINSVKHAG